MNFLMHQMGIQFVALKVDGTKNAVGLFFFHIFAYTDSKYVQEISANFKVSLSFEPIIEDT